jgi:hypothetical protein
MKAKKILKDEEIKKKVQKWKFEKKKKECAREQT